MTRIEADGPAIPYTPPEVAAPNARQFLTVFTPPQPRGGVLITTDAGNFLDTDPRTVFDDALEPSVTWITSLWSKGVTIVSAGLTGWNGGHVGGGLFRAYDSPEYLGDYTFSWPERDAEWIVQKVHNLTTSGGLAGQPSKIGWFGVSSGGVCGLAVGLGPDRRRATGSQQVRTSTLLRFVVAIEVPFWWPAYDQSAVAGLHFPAGGTGTQPAARLQDVPLDLQAAGSPLAWWSDRMASGLGQPPLYLAYDEPVESTDFSLAVDGTPELFDTLASVHPYWHGVQAGRILATANATRWTQRARLVATPGIVLPPPNDLQHLTVPSLFDGVMQPDLEAWVLAELGLAGPSPVVVTPIGDQPADT